MDSAFLLFAGGSFFVPFLAASAGFGGSFFAEDDLPLAAGSLAEASGGGGDGSPIG
jgi:hypothetical protein